MNGRILLPNYNTFLNLQEIILDPPIKFFINFLTGIAFDNKNQLC